VGDGGTLLHFNGGAWSPEPSGSVGSLGSLHDVWGDAAGTLWVAGSPATAAGGVVLRRDGGAWSTSLGSSLDELESTWGSGPSDVWAVGTRGDVMHFDGHAWS